MVYVHFVFAVVLGVALLRYGYRRFYRPEVTEDTHLNVPRWRSILVSHTYLSMLVPCHYRCGVLHALQCLMSVDLIMLFLGALLQRLPTTSTPVSIMLCSVTCVVVCVVHCIFDKMMFSWKFDEVYIRRLAKYRRKQSASMSIASGEDLMSGDGYENRAGGGFWGEDGARGGGGGISRNALDALDKVRFDRRELAHQPSPQGRSYKVDSTVFMRPSRGDDDEYEEDSASYGDDGGDNRVDMGEDFAFIGLYRPEDDKGETTKESPPFPRSQTAAPDAIATTRRESGQPRVTIQTPRRITTPQVKPVIEEHKENILYDDEVSSSSSHSQDIRNRLNSHHDDSYSDRSSSADTGYDAGYKTHYHDNESDVDSETQRQQKREARNERRRASERAQTPQNDALDVAVEEEEEVVPEATAFDDDDNAMFLYGQFAVDLILESSVRRTDRQTTVKKKESAADMSRRSTVVAELTPETEPISATAEPDSTVGNDVESAPRSPKSILNKYSKYAESQQRSSIIDPFDETAKELGDRPRVWTPIVAYNIRTTTLTLLVIAGCIAGQWYTMKSLDGISAGACDSYPWFLYLTIGAHCFIFEPLVMALTYLHRMLNSDEYDDFFSELHPYTGDVRDSGPAA